MLNSDKNTTATDVARSMRRLGFSREGIYDTLTGAGIPGGEVQLLLDRIEDEFEDTELESRISQLAEEVEKIFGSELEKFKIEFESSMRSVNEDLKSVLSCMESLENRIIELQGSCGRIKGNMEE